jgi:hypothetical protein
VHLETSSTSPTDHSIFSPSVFAPSNNSDGSTSSPSSMATNQKMPAIRSTSLDSPGPCVEHSPCAVEYRTSEARGSAALEYASLSFGEALKEIKEEIGEEAEYEPIMSKSAPASRTQYGQQNRCLEDSVEVRFFQCFKQVVVRLNMWFGSD